MKNRTKNQSGTILKKRISKVYAFDRKAFDEEYLWK
jgi:hypothetical protein